MAMRAHGTIRRAMAWAAQPYLCLGLAIGGLVVADTWPRHATCHGGVEIEDVPADAGPGQLRDWARRHRDICASCRRAAEEDRRRLEDRRKLRSNPPQARDGDAPGWPGAGGTFEPIQRPDP